ncbi:MAG: RIP metalloprotease RseP [Mariprofundaceae bacterium]
MIDTLYTVVSFVVAIALLIAVHEYGHFIVARKLGIKVEKFSIGFGPSLLSWRSKDGEVEYIIAAIPLGGYVKMLGENPSEQGEEAKKELSEEDKTRAFDYQPVWKRASVAVAGPLFNLFFAIAAYMLIGWMGQMVLPPVIGSLGPASVAEQVGLMEGDVIRQVDGDDVYSWFKFEELLKQSAGHDMVLNIDRNGTELIKKMYLPAPEKDVLLVNVADVSLGVTPGMDVLIDDVSEGSPAAMGGLQKGDQLISVQGLSVKNVGQLIEVIREHGGKSISLQVRRGEVHLDLSVIPNQDDAGIGRIGVRLMAVPQHEVVLYQMSPWEGFKYGFIRTWDMTAMTLNVLSKMATAAISPENLGGPIAIAQLAGKTASLGLVAFVSFLALISVNLAVLNLLPIPVLDGGHLVYLGIEKIRGKPLSPAIMEKAQIVGMSLIIMLMLFAFYNDLIRLFRG